MYAADRPLTPLRDISPPWPRVLEPNHADALASAASEHVRSTLALSDARCMYDEAAAEHLQAVRAHARCQREVRATTRQLEAADAADAAARGASRAGVRSLSFPP